MCTGVFLYLYVCECVHVCTLVCEYMCVRVCVYMYVYSGTLRPGGTRYVHVAEVNGIIEKYTGVWPMADSELCLETSG